MNELQQLVAGDLDAVRRLLESCSLSAQDLRPEHLANFLGVMHDGRLVAVGGLELLGAAALLRSVAVAPAHRQRRLAGRIVAALEDRARSASVGELYLLTDTADAYFQRAGYDPVPRTQAPPAIAHSSQFAELCPASAVLMRKVL